MRKESDTSKPVLKARHRKEFIAKYVGKTEKQVQIFAQNNGLKLRNIDDALWILKVLIDKTRDLPIDGTPSIDNSKDD